MFKGILGYVSGSYDFTELASSGKIGRQQYKKQEHYARNNGVQYRYCHFGLSSPFLFSQAR